MSQSRIADRYAKSLMDLAIEKDQLEALRSDMQTVKKACQDSQELATLLKSPVVKADQKNKILSAIFAGKLSELASAFLALLVRKGREADLAGVAQAFLQQYNALKGIHEVKLTTAAEISTEMKEGFAAKLKEAMGFANIELETKTDPALIGGFVLEFDQQQVDASIAHDLREIRKSFSENLYIQNLR
jgi:F-type H+-transporting ATPase subunit delta